MKDYNLIAGWLLAGAWLGRTNQTSYIRALAGSLTVTGQKDRYSTTEKLWKIDDDQLTTPKHDELVLSVLANGKKIFNTFKKEFEIYTRYGIDEYFLYNNEWSYNRHVGDLTDLDRLKSPIQIHNSTNSNIIDIDFGSNDAIKNQSLININNTIPTPKILSEVPLKAGNGFLIGFLDVLLATDLIKEKTYIINSFETKIKDTSYKYELVQTITIYMNSLGIEIKPIITSFGQTLRQLNTYREYFSGKLILCTNDFRFKDAFESQGITVISPNGNGDK